MGFFYPTDRQKGLIKKKKGITSEFWCIQVIKSMWWSKKYNIGAHSVVERKNKVAIRWKCSSASTSACASVVLTLKLCCFGCWVPAHTEHRTSSLDHESISESKCLFLWFLKQIYRYLWVWLSDVCDLFISENIFVLIYTNYHNIWGTKQLNKLHSYGQL